MPLTPILPSGTEDCLYMNIYVPSEAVETTLPVMFWIYGGGACFYALCHKGASHDRRRTERGSLLPPSFLSSSLLLSPPLSLSLSSPLSLSLSLSLSPLSRCRYHFATELQHRRGIAARPVLSFSLVALLLALPPLSSLLLRRFSRHAWHLCTSASAPPSGAVGTPHPVRCSDRRAGRGRPCNALQNFPRALR